MSLSSALNIISSSFAANAAQMAVVSGNITNANTTGYSLKTANVATNSYGGADVVSVTRAADIALLDQVLTSTSQAASQQALSTGLTALAATVSDSSAASSSSGATQDGQSPSAMLSNLQSALATYQASPNSESAGDAVVTAADDLASSLNNGSAAVQQVRQQADAGMASSVATINSLLDQFTQVNNTIVGGLHSGADVTNAEDSRDNILTQLSQQIGISTVTNSNGSMSIYTDSGVTLFQDTPSTVAFTPSTTLTAGVNGNAVTVGGVPITGPSAPMAIQSGALAGLANLRDTVAPEYQAQLDQISNGLISAFAETPQSTASTSSPTPPPALPGLFTYFGAAGMPTTSTGLASLIEVNPSVDPSQGGNVDLLRDGGIADPTDAFPSTTGGSVYTYNTTGAASYGGRISDLISGLSATQAFDPSAGLGSSDSLSDYANASVSWLQAQNQQASDQSTYQTSLVTQATGALSNATGVNLDAEMNNMLNLENTYTTSAKLLTTVDDMFNSLLASITPG
jgi:flagellar hook-associated protein 1 FlgK